MYIQSFTRWLKGHDMELTATTVHKLTTRYELRSIIVSARIIINLHGSTTAVPGQIGKPLYARWYISIPAVTQISDNSL